MNKAHSCSVYKKCGGCQLTNLSYQEQLSYKMSRVIALLGKFCRVSEIIGMDDPYHYRNKMQAAFSQDTRGHVISGVWQSSGNKVVKTDLCILEDEMSCWIVRAVRGMMREYGMTVYNPKNKKGLVRHVLVRRAFASGEILLAIVTSGEKFLMGKEFAESITKRFPHIRTVVECVNDTDIPLWIGDKQTVLYGDGYIEDELCGCFFRLSANSFYQINPIQTEVLYNIALEFANLKPSDTVFDAYCGVGTIGIIAAENAGHVIGAEINAEAVRNAIENCKLNHTKNYRIYKADAGKVMTELSKTGKKLNVVFTDPPRAGCSKEFLSSLVKASPERIVYVSCNPETLARDLLFLIKNNYRVKHIQPVDMFPHTKHVETVCLLSKKA